jgi:hypothetical protein
LCDGFINVVARGVVDAENENIVDLYSDEYLAFFRVVDTCVRREWFVAEEDDLATQTQIPDTGGLFEAMERLVEA